MRSYKQPGHTLTFTAPAGGVVSGQMYKIGQFLVVAAYSAAAGAAFEGMLDGVHTLAKTSAQAWTVGQLVYWDDTAKLLTTTAATGNELVGAATAVAANPSTTGTVRMNGTVRPNEP